MEREKNIREIDLKGKLEAKNDTKAASMDPNTRELIAGTLNDKIDILVASGSVSKVVADELKLSLVGKEGARCMSMIGIQDGEKLSTAQKVIGILSKNKASEMKELSGYQVLGRELPDDEVDKTEEFDKKQSDRMLSAAGVKDPDKVTVPE